MVFVPPRFAADSILEAEDAGIELIICITEGIPAHDELRVYNHLKRNARARLVGPNCPGIKIFLYNLTKVYYKGV